jgi:hypothetical protein
VDFETQTQEDLYARVAMHLRDGFGELAEPIAGEPAFIIELGPTTVLLTIDANGPEKASVMINGRVGGGILLTPDVATYLIHKAHDLALITLSATPDDQISARQVILGEAATRENLGMMIRVFTRCCEELDDELTLQFR